MDEWSVCVDLWFRADELGEALLDRTPHRFLADLIYLAVRMHKMTAIFFLLVRAKKLGQVHLLMPCIACKPRCGMCRGVRSFLLPSFQHAGVLDDDFAAVRVLLKRSAEMNLYAMRKPIFLLDDGTDAITEYIHSRTSMLWKKVLFAAFARSLWSRWVAKQLHPDSRYVKKLAFKFYGLAGTI